ncbi:MAG: ATP-binding protein [Syntrophales bacterium]
MTLKNIVDALHAYAYGRWTSTVIGLMRDHIIPRLTIRGKEKFADGFHFKVLTNEHARAIISINQDIPRLDLEQIIPYSQARTLVLKAPLDIIVYECACRHTRTNHCNPTQVCMMIGKSVTNFILKYHPETSRRITEAEALALLKAEHERGHVHTAWFKDVIGGRFYALCNCCKCCCFGIEAMTAHGVPMAVSSGYVASVDAGICNACGICEDACPFDAVSMDGTAHIHWDKCMGCGVCKGQCRSGALSLVRDERKGIPLDVRLLVKETDVTSPAVSS